MVDQRESILRFDLRTLLIATGIVAIACTALATGAEFWDQVFDVVTLVSLSGGLVASIANHGSRRVFWLAFVVFSTMYLLASYNAFTSLGIRDGMPTNDWVEALAKWIHPPPDLTQPGSSVLLREMSVAARVGFQLAALLVGLLAAYISQAIYVVSERRQLLAARNGDDPADVG